MPDWLPFFLQVAIETFTLFVLFVGLVGLIIPIFPGLFIMWLAILLYALIQDAANMMTTWDWVAFGIITALMIGGNIADNLIIARKMRDQYIPWSSIFIAFTASIIVSIFFTPIFGLIAAPLGLFFAENRRLKNRDDAWKSTKVYMVGWGWAFGARFAVGITIIVLWMLWAWI
jgi:uncharacterized protein YqgC (DUF456 family)